MRDQVIARCRVVADHPPPTPRSSQPATTLDDPTPFTMLQSDSQTLCWAALHTLALRWKGRVRVGRVRAGQARCRRAPMQYVSVVHVHRSRPEQRRTNCRIIHSHTRNNLAETCTPLTDKVSSWVEGDLDTQRATEIGALRMSWGLPWTIALTEPPDR